MKASSCKFLICVLGLLTTSLLGITEQLYAKEVKKTDKPTAVRSGYQHYFNDKYGYTIDYPSSLLPQGEPDAQDGQRFLSPSSPLKMSVWATYSNWQSGDEMTIEEERNWTLQHLASDELPAAKVIHKTSGKDWFVLSGVSKKNIFYQRTLKIHDAFVTVLFIYPQTKKIEFEPVVLPAARSLKE